MLWRLCIRWWTLSLVPFIALTLLVGQKKQHQACKKTCWLTQRISFGGPDGSIRSSSGRLYRGPVSKQSSAIAEVGDRGHNRHGPKTGGCAAFRGGAGFQPL